MKLEILSKEDCEKARIWRNRSLETLRTPYPLTKEGQEAFYQDVICNPKSPHRYWGIHNGGSETDYKIDDQLDAKGQALLDILRRDRLIGMGGLTNIEWENSQAEISLIIDPARQSQGYGKEAVILLLDQAFNHLGLDLVYGECYLCNEKGVDFWTQILKDCSADTSSRILGKGKYWQSRRWSTMYFDITKEDFNKATP